MPIRKTIETSDDPTFVITNAVEGMPYDDAYLYVHHWGAGEGETLPRVDGDTPGVIYLGRSDILELIEALQEFVRRTGKLNL